MQKDYSSSATIESGKNMPAFTVLENSPEVMNHLAHSLGLSPELRFHEIYSFDPDILSSIPRPAHALQVIFPLTEAWAASRKAEDGDSADKQRSHEDHASPVLWFKQTIPHACGSISVLHCTLNGAATAHIFPESPLSRLRETALVLPVSKRGLLLEKTATFAAAHAEAAKLGSSRLPSVKQHERLGQHFVAFVKINGHLWELEGSRRGPIDRGKLADDEDILSPRALAMGVDRVISLGGRDVRFSALALSRSES